MKRRKTLLIWASVINFVATLFFIYSAVILINNVDGFADQMKQMLIEMYGDTNLAIEYLNMCGQYFIVSAVINAVFGVIYLWFALMKEKTFFKHKTWLTVTAIINVFLGMGLISLILVLIVILTVKSQQSFEFETITPQNTQVGLSSNSEELKEQLKIRNMAEKIEFIKHLKQEGNITEAEYNKLLDEIISEGVKEE